MTGRGLASLAVCACAALVWGSTALADPSNTSPPQLSGSDGGMLAVDAAPTLSLSTGSWSSSSPDDLTYAFQWQSCSYPNAVLANAPVAYYRLGEAAGSTEAADVSGFSQPSVPVPSSAAGAAGAIAGDGDTAYQFPLRTFVQGILYPLARGPAFVPSDFASGTSPASIEAWVNPSGAPYTDGYIAGFGSDTADQSSLNLELYNTGSAIRLAANDGTRRYVATSGSIAAGRWYHVVLTYDGTAIRLYLDGALVGAFNETSTFSLVPDVARIDASVPATSALQQFGGAMDDVAFYDDALDTATVKAHATAGTTASAAVRCEDIAGATSPTLTVSPDLAGTRIRGQVEATDDAGATAAWSDEVAVGGSVAVAQPQDLTSSIPFGPTLVGGTVVAADGSPVAGARVSVYSNLATRTRVTEPLLAETYTDANGAYSVSFGGLDTPLLNLIVVARGAGFGATTYVAREYDSDAGLWLDDAGALPGSVDLVLPTDGSSTAFSGPSRRFPVPCPPPRKSLVAGPKPGIMSVADVHTWSYVKGQLTYIQGSKTTVNVAASVRPSGGFVSTSATKSFSGGYTLSQQYPVRGPNTNIAETTAADAAEYLTISSCWKYTYTVEPYAFIGGTTTPRSVSAGSNGRCPTHFTDNSTFYVPGAKVTRSNGRGVTYSGGFSINFGLFSVGLAARTDWSSNTSETWYPQPGGGGKVWFCGDGTAQYWFNAQRIYNGPWTS